MRSLFAPLDRGPLVSILSRGPFFSRGPLISIFLLAGLFAQSALGEEPSTAAVNPDSVASGAVASDAAVESKEDSKDETKGATGEKGTKAATPIFDPSLDPNFDPALDPRLDPRLDPLPDSGVAEAIGVFLKTMLALAFILLLAYLTLSKGVGKLVAKSQQGKDVRVVERIGLDQRRSLYLIEVEGRRLLIGTSEGGMTTLADLTQPSSPPAQFAQVMAGASAAPAAVPVPEPVPDTVPEGESDAIIA